MQALFSLFSGIFSGSEADGAAEVLNHVARGADHFTQALFAAALVGGDDHAQRRADHHSGAHALQKVHCFHVVPPFSFGISHP